MMMRLVLLTPLVVVVHSALHAPPPTPKGWIDTTAGVDEDLDIDLVFSIREDVTALEAHAIAVSDPSSPLYGDFLNAEELDALVAPEPADVAAVISWLAKAGVEPSELSGNRIKCKTTVQTASSLLKTKFSFYYSNAEEISVPRPGAYALPDHIEPLVSAIFGIHGLPVRRRERIGLGDDPKAAKVTPDVLKEVYNISGVTIDPSSKNVRAVAEFQGCSMDQKDLTTFFKDYVKGSKDDTVSKYVGDKGKGASCGEGLLDIEYIMGPSPGIKTEYWLKNPFDLCSDIAEWAAALLKADEPPLVHSISYGESGPDSQCNAAKLSTIENDFMKLASRGITIIVSSGDSGSGYVPSDDKCGALNFEDGAYAGEVLRKVKVDATDGNGPGACCMEATDAPNPISAGWSVKGTKKDADCTIYKTVTGKTSDKGAQRAITAKRIVKLYPSWPATSNWVTAVGSTRFVDHKIGAEQMATDSFGSGGGFSRSFNVSAWQSTETAAYLKTAASFLPPAGSFVPNGRATPDVAVLGEGYQIIQDGQVQEASGTSASAPVFASIVSLLNEARLAAGKKPMGFMNPFLYKNPSTLTDIVKGDNPNSNEDYPVYGFNCTKGWDPVTGLGTPNFPALLKAAMA